MVNYLDLKWLLDCKKQLKSMADDPIDAAKVVEYLDTDPDLRDELSGVYTRALRTLESFSKTSSDK